MRNILLCRKLFPPWSNYTGEFLLGLIINSSPNEGTFFLCIEIYVNIEIVEKFDASIAVSPIDG